MPINSSQTATTPLVALDYESLRQQGIAWLEKLSGLEWTDFNAHDPGITILEQLCYTLTDLSYRINYDMADLLSRDGKDSYDSLFKAEQILTTKAITLLDLRKLAIDVDGVNNAWIEPISESSPALFYFEKPVFLSGEKAITLTEGEGANSLSLQGLYNVWLEKSPYQDDINDNDLVQKVAERLHEQRGLAVDFNAIQVIDTCPIQVRTSIEIEASADPDEIYIGILNNLADYLSPPVHFYSFEDCLAQGKAIDEIFSGPLLDHGFIDDQELNKLSLKRYLYASDLIRVIMDVPGVRLVEFAAFYDGINYNDTILEVHENRAPNLEINGCSITLKKRQVPIQQDLSSLINRFLGNRKSALPRKNSSIRNVPQGRDRHIANYYSLLEQFPKIYGIGETGLPSSASEQRKAQASQLKAYLLFFDQLLANSFSQLAHVRELFSFNYDHSDSYIAATLDSPGTNGLWQESDSTERQKKLQGIFGVSQPSFSDEQPFPDSQRNNRFLDHLLARFAEHFADYSHFNGAPSGGSRGSRVLGSKLALLRSFDKISASKGVGINILQTGDDNFVGLAQLLRLKLGILETDKLYVIDHILLRPISDDARQIDLPVLTNARKPDPYSMQLTVAIFCSINNDQNRDYRRFAEQTVRDETPAHLKVYVRWLDPAQQAVFDESYLDFLNHQKIFRASTINNKPNPGQEDKSETSIPFREARDRLIELLGIGNTYPLRDLSVPDPAMVAYGKPGTIVIKSSQEGVIYSLFDIEDHDNKTIIDQQNGSDSELNLTIKSIDKTQQFVIQATKAESSLSTQLLQTPTITVGLELDLVAEITNANSFSVDDKPIQYIDYGTSVSVDIKKTQKGVGYQLIEGDTVENYAIKSTKEVSGNGETITLTSVNFDKDIDIRILATNQADTGIDTSQKQAILNNSLPLKVRANPNLIVNVPNAIIDYESTASLVIQNAQVDVSYQAYTRSIRSIGEDKGHEYIHDEAQNSESVLKIPVPGKDDVKLRIPADTTDFDNSNDSAAGKGGDLTLSLINKLTEDSFIAIQATKTHTVNGNPVKSPSITLANITAVLVKPNANIALNLDAIVDSQSNLLHAPITVSGGQEGVFYEFKVANKVQDKIYFYKQGKGIGNMAVEVDFVVADDANVGGIPETILNETVTLKADDKLAIRAIKAESGVEVDVNFNGKVGDLLKKKGDVTKN